MVSRSSIFVWMLLLCLHLIIFLPNNNIGALAQTNLEKRTKFCADPKCKEDLFSTMFTRKYDPPDPNFIQADEGTLIKVVAFKFSNRPDFLQAEKTDGVRGLVYNGLVDLEPYVHFLESALKQNQKLYIVEQESGKQIGETNAISARLDRDYITYANRVPDYKLDTGLVAKFMEAEQSQKSSQQHNHGHSHSHQHEHSSHGHSHEHGGEKSAEETKIANERPVEEKENKVEKVAKAMGTETDGNAQKVIATDEKSAVNPKTSEEQTLAEKTLETKPTMTDNKQEVKPVVKVSKGKMARIEWKTYKDKFKATTSEAKAAPEPKTVDEQQKAVNQVSVEEKKPPPPPPVAAVPNVEVPKAAEKEVPKPIPMKQSIPNEAGQQPVPAAGVEVNVPANSPKTSNAAHKEEGIVGLKMEEMKRKEEEEMMIKQKPNNGGEEMKMKAPEPAEIIAQVPPIPVEQKQQSPVQPPIEQPPPQTAQIPQAVQPPTQLPPERQQPELKVQQQQIDQHHLNQEEIVQQPEVGQEQQQIAKGNAGVGGVDAANPQAEPLRQLDLDELMRKKVGGDGGAGSFNSAEDPILRKVGGQQMDNSGQQSNSAEMPSQAEEHPPPLPPPINAEVPMPEPVPITPSPVQQAPSAQQVPPAHHQQPQQHYESAWNSINIPPSPPPIPAPAAEMPTAPPPLPPADEMPMSNSQQQSPEENKPEDLPPIDNQPNLGKQQHQEQQSGAVEEEKLNYCYEDDCRQLDDLPAAENTTQQQATADSKVRKMFRETMATVRAQLPEPLCHFEDTGLIVLAFVICSLIAHLINMMFLSKSSGPEPFDHRLLHDCITRLKEQELIIEQLRTKAVDNQRLAEVARTAEQLEKENRTLAERKRSAETRASDLEADNGKLKHALKSIHHELEQNKAEVEELRADVENRDAELKRIETERQKLEAALDDSVAKLAQAQNRAAYLDADLKEALAQAGRLKSECDLAQREAEKWRNECGEKRAEVDELLGIIAELDSGKQQQSQKHQQSPSRSAVGSKRGSSAGLEAPEEKKSKKVVGAATGTKKQKKNGDDDNHDGSPPTSSPGSSPGGHLVDVAELDSNNGTGSGGSGWSDLGDRIEIGGSGGGPKQQKRSFEEERIVEEEVEEEEEEGEEEEEHGRKTVVEQQGKQQQKTGGKLLDILGMAKLKGRVRSLETEREQLKFTLKLEREEKENAQNELDRLRQELLERERDSEQRELDRHGMTQQCTKLLQMIEEKERKVEHSEQERERLRGRLADVESELRRVDDERREVLHRLKEMEQSLKRSEELNGRLENKLFHEGRRLNGQIRQLEEKLSLAKSSLSPLNMSGGGLSSDLNMSGNSSDRDFIPLTSSPEGAKGGGGAGGIPSLWSEIDAAEPVEELVALERRGGSMSRRRRSILRTTGDGGNTSGNNGSARESPFLADLVHVTAAGREDRLNSSKYSVHSSATMAGNVSSTAGAPRQRMRSRSAGRQSARLTGVSAAASATNPMYGGGGHGGYGGYGSGLYSSATMSSSFYRNPYHRASVVPQQTSSGKASPYRQLPDRPHSAARLRGLMGAAGTSAAGASKTAAGAYSSDSNEASSPPPEMPLLSGVPPPGLNKRPAVICPPKSAMGVQLHKPAPK